MSEIWRIAGQSSPLTLAVTRESSSTTKCSTERLTPSLMKRKNRVCGLFPRSVYRCFEKEEYAVQFVEEGRFRVGSLERYKCIEDAARRDSTEGEGLYGLRGPVVSGRISVNADVPAEWISEVGIQQHHTQALNSVYLFCCANLSADLEFLRRRFGRYVVKIVSPVVLAIEIDHALNGYDGNSGPFLVEGRDVEYNKGSLITDGRSAHELSDLSYAQKPADYRDEKEFRFCIMSTGGAAYAAGNAESYLDIALGSGRMSYAEML